MTVQKHLARASARLKRAGINQPRLEAESLLAYALKKDAAWILAHPEAAIAKNVDRRFLQSVEKRARRIPFAYVVGVKAFYGREFLVTKDVLIPRPETETLIEAALTHVIPAKAGIFRAGLDFRFRGNDKMTILDVGTGSGAIGLTLLAELPDSSAILVDFSAKALAVARRNASRLKLSKRVRLLKMDILKKGYFASLRMTNGNDLILTANLPYLPLPAMKRTGPEVRHEPRLALVSGRDGLRHYRALAARLREHGPKPDLMLLEAEPGQMRRLEALMRKALPAHRFRRIKDLFGDERVLVASR